MFFLACKIYLNKANINYAIFLKFLRREKMLKKLFLLLTACICFLSYPKNLIITFVYSNPEFIAMQNKTFKKFLQDDYEYVVFSDAPTEKEHEAINAMCAQLDVRCIRIPQNIHEYPYYLPLNMPQIYPNHQTPSNVRHVHCVQYALDNFCFDMMVSYC